MASYTGPLIADVRMKDSGGTERTVITTTGGIVHQSTVLPDSSQLAPLKLLTWPSTAAQTLVNTTGVQTLQYKSIGQGCGLEVALGSTANAAIPAYGVVYFTATTSAQAYDLPLPEKAGAQLVLYANTANTSDTITLATSAVNLINGYYKTIVLAGSGQCVSLVGLSTTLGWAVQSIGSTTLAGCTSLPTFTS